MGEQDHLLNPAAHSFCLSFSSSWQMDFRRSKLYFNEKVVVMKKEVKGGGRQ
jgi:hypothetical protein